MRKIFPLVRRKVEVYQDQLDELLKGKNDEIKRLERVIESISQDYERVLLEKQSLFSERSELQSDNALLTKELNKSESTLSAMVQKLKETFDIMERYGVKQQLNKNIDLTRVDLTQMFDAKA